MKWTDAIRELFRDIAKAVISLVDELRRILSKRPAGSSARRKSTGRAEKDAPRTDRAARGLAGFAAAKRKCTAATGQ